MNEKKAHEALQGHMFKVADYERTIYRAYPEEGTTAEDMLSRSYWAHIAKGLKPLDKIEAVAKDGTWYAEYLVLGCDRLWAKIVMLHKVNLSTADVSASQAEDSFTIKYVAGHKWCVLTKPDYPTEAPGYLKEGCLDRDEAKAWLKGHILTTA